MKKQKVLVWLSGGVDSAVTAHLLLQQWYEVIAGFMKNYAEPDNPHCTTRQDRDSALKVAAHLGIKTFIIFDFREEYQERIIDYIYAWYQQGLTPNPDVFCNNLIKFDLFLEQAISLWCDYVATGHYGRVRRWKDFAEDYEDCSQQKKHKNATMISEKHDSINIKTYDIIWTCMDIHKELWNVWTEKQYENIVKDRLWSKWYHIAQQVPIEVCYQWKKYWNRFIDMVVDDSIVLEFKRNNNEYDLKKWFKQIRSYIDIGNYDSGLLIDFWWSSLKYNRFNRNTTWSLQSSESTQSSAKSCYLLRGLDHTKDQSYFLSRLSQYQLSHALFPLWELTKTQVRQIAHDISLPNADRPDSQGLCFIGDVPMAEFLRKKLPETEWDIIDQTGKKVWTHKGARFYTLGQRHQLFLPFKAYVTAIDVKNNIVTVWDKDDEKLLSDRVSVTDRVWTGDVVDEDALSSCLVKIRYRQNPPIPAQLITPYDATDMTFTIPETRWVTPGQILVVYTADDKVVGSGVMV